jgi:hypothetical protein
MAENNNINLNTLEAAVKFNKEIRKNNWLLGNLTYNKTNWRKTWKTFYKTSFHTLIV